MVVPRQEDLPCCSLPREPLDDKKVLNAAEAAILSSHIRLGCPLGNRSHCERHLDRTRVQSAARVRRRHGRSHRSRRLRRRRKIWEGSLRGHPVEML